jgi:hypothetical protein
MPDRLDANSHHRAVAWADLNMLVGPGGCQRTEGEFRALLQGAGFALTQIIPTALGFSVLEAAPG